MDDREINIILCPQLFPAHQVAKLLEAEFAACDFAAADQLLDGMIHVMYLAQGGENRVCLLRRCQ
jgi:hypothetical protein